MLEYLFNKTAISSAIGAVLGVAIYRWYVRYMATNPSLANIHVTYNEHLRIIIDPEKIKTILIPLIIKNDPKYHKMHSNAMIKFYNEMIETEYGVNPFDI